MKKYSCIIALILCGLTSFSQTTTEISLRDIFDNTTYQNNNQNQGLYFKDVFGNVKYQDNKGTNATYFKDALGNIQFQDNKGNSGTYTKDVFGNIIYTPIKKF